MPYDLRAAAKSYGVPRLEALCTEAISLGADPESGAEGWGQVRDLVQTEASGIGTEWCALGVVGVFFFDVHEFVASRSVVLVVALLGSVKKGEFGWLGKGFDVLL